MVITAGAIRYLEGYERCRCQREQQPFQTEFVSRVRSGSAPRPSPHGPRRSPVSRPGHRGVVTSHFRRPRQHGRTRAATVEGTHWMPLGMVANTIYPTENTMKPTDNEIASARRLADALLAFVSAVEIGMAQRHNEAPAVQSPETNSREKLLLTSREAAEALSISGRTLWQMTSPRGPIPVVRIGTSVRYAIEDLAAVVAALKVTDDKSSLQGGRHA